MNKFPNRVWEPTGMTETGKNLWSSSELTQDDIRRRNRLVEEATRRIEAARLAILNQ